MICPSTIKEPCGICREVGEINVRNATASHYGLAWLLLPFGQEAEDMTGAWLI